MIVLGIDPGSQVTGFGIIEWSGSTARVLEYGVIKPPPSSDHVLKLARIHEGILEVLDDAKPDTCAIEMPVYGRNAQSMLKLGRAQAAAMLAAMRREVPVTEYTPKQVKKSVTGNGNATKQQVWFMVSRILSLDESRGLDASDALAVGLCHSHRLHGGSDVATGARSWDAFVRANPDRVR